MTAKTAEQIAKELESLRASKKEIESKISSLSYDLRVIKDEDKQNQQRFEDNWREDVDQLERIDEEITSLQEYFEAINLTVFAVVRRHNKICLYDTTRYIDVDSIKYNRKNLDEILDWLDYHKTYAAFYRDVMRKYLTFDKPNYITRIGSQMRFEVNAKDEALDNHLIIVTLQTLKRR